MRPEVRLLGPATVRIGAHAWEPAANRRSAVLFYLAYVGSWVPRDDLLHLFWPDSDEQKGRANLRQSLVALRTLPFAESLEAERTRVRWPATTDVAAWGAALDRGDLGGARGGWPRPLLEGFRLPSAPEFESWLELERSVGQERFRGALLRAVERGVDDAGDEGLTRLLEGWLAIAPLDEEILCTWLAVCARAGRRTAALARFAAFEAPLATEIGMAPERATVALVDALRGAAGPPVKLAAARDSVAPVRVQRAPGGTFFGRASELARLETELLRSDSPVVTLLAAGGIGKTRLAVAAADRLGPRFADGAAVVWLAGARALNEVAPALLGAVGEEPMPLRSPLEQAAEALAERRMLVVLDNLEQLPGVDAVVARLRSAAPGVAWLLTSRERLGDRRRDGVRDRGVARARARCGRPRGERRGRVAAGAGAARGPPAGPAAAGRGGRAGVPGDGGHAARPRTRGRLAAGAADRGHRRGVGAGPRGPGGDRCRRRPALREHAGGVRRFVARALHGRTLRAPAPIGLSRWLPRRGGARSRRRRATAAVGPAQQVVPVARRRRPLLPAPAALGLPAGARGQRPGRGVGRPGGARTLLPRPPSSSGGRGAARRATCACPGCP